MLINCAELKGLSSMIIISATFITIIFLESVTNKFASFISHHLMIAH